VERRRQRQMCIRDSINTVFLLKISLVETALSSTEIKSCFGIFSPINNGEISSAFSAICAELIPEIANKIKRNFFINTFFLFIKQR
jgi:hypothetical protein